MGFCAFLKEKTRNNMEGTRMSTTNWGTAFGKLAIPLTIAVIGGLGYLGYLTFNSHREKEERQKERDKAEDFAYRMFYNETDLKKMQVLASNICANPHVSPDFKAIVTEKINSRITDLKNVAEEAKNQEMLKKKRDEERKTLEAEGRRLAEEKELGIREIIVLADTGNYAEVTNAVIAAKAKYNLNDGEVRQLTDRAYGNTLDGMLESLTKTNGIGKVEKLGQIIARFPEYDDVNELRKEQLAIYSEIVCPLLSSKSADEKANADLNKTLKTFQKWLKGQDMKAFENSEFTDLRNALGSYSKDAVKSEGKKEYRLGDRVVTRQNLGPMGDEEKSRYFHGIHTADVPLGTEGVVKGINDNGQSISVRFPSRNNRQGYFILDEIGDVKFSFNVGKNMRKAAEILDYIAEARGKK